MNEQLYDIHFGGQLLEGVSVQQARDNLARLFKVDPAKLSGLFNGQPQVIKRGLDKTAALKYKAALHKAGLMVAARPQQTDPPTPAPTTKPAEPAASDTALTLAPAGSDVLREDERRRVTAPTLDLSGYQLSSPFLEPELPDRPAPPAPDTSHMSIAATGERLGPERAGEEPAAPDISHLTLAETGSDLEQLPDSAAPLDPDTSDLELAPEGSPVLPEGHRRPAPPPPPDTSHIGLQDD